VTARIGTALYTVRDECARDLEGTLVALSEMGYEGVELFDLQGYSPQRFVAASDAAGLALCGRHVSFAVLERDLPAVARDAEILGTCRIVLGWIEPPSSEREARAVVERLVRAADEAAVLGLELGFHNHDGELRRLDGGVSFVDLLLEQPTLFLELDLGWVWWAGADPLEVLESTRGRSPLVHVKDFRARGERSFCPVGDGGVGYERVAPAAVAAGAEWLLVEQDETDGAALDAVRRSYSALDAMLRP
jgi:sugar phosphate isomerase/epimerase